MYNWKETTLGEVVESANTGLDAIRRAPIVEEDTGIRCLRIQDISQEKPFNKWGNTKVEPRDYKKYQLKANDIIMARTCSTGINLLIKNDLNAVFNNGLARIRADKEYALPVFLYYIFQSYAFTGFINGISGGTSVQLNMKLGDLLSYEFLLPPLPEQKAIAAILSSFDDKIELLRQQNKTLESIAQTIFKEWFNNFKVNGKKQKVNSSTGLPEGWRMGNLGEILELSYGKALKEEQRTGKGYPVIGSSGIVGYHGEYLVKGFGIVVGRKGSMGTVIWVEDNFFPIDTTFYVVDKLGVGDLFFHFFVLKNIDFQKIGSDSAVPGLNRNLASSSELVVPRKEAVEGYNKTVEPIFQKMKNNNSQIQTLSKLRDALLPKLMKGEIRVGEK